MGIGEGKEEKEPVRQRRFSRQSSISSRLSCDEVIPLKSDGTGSSISGRKRTPSGKSIVSRTISLAEYHGDLRPSLKHGFTRNLALVCFTVYFGSSFLFGYNIGVLNQPVNLIKEFYNETYVARSGEVSGYLITFLWSFTTAIYFPGGMIGAFSSGFLAKRLGRNRGIMVSTIPNIIGGVLQGLCVIAKSPELLIIGRFITGVGCGIGSQLAPMFISEIAPYNLRGALGTGHQLFVTIGIFVGSVLGLREILGTAELWIYLLLFNAFPAFVSLVILKFLPESPRYLMLEANDRIAAEKSLRFLRQTLDVNVDIEEMETEAAEMSYQEDDTTKAYSMKQLLTERALMIPLLITIVLQVAQQFSGINCIFFYSSGIFENAGVASDKIQYAVVVTNLVNVGMTFVAVALMDRVGRRPLLLYPMIVMTIDMAVITAALNLHDTYSWTNYISIACVIIYVICFAIGLGPIPWMMAPELFRQGPRSMAMSVAGATNWLCTTIIAISFELIHEAIKEFTFILFLVLMIGFTTFVFFKAPETKNKTFEEIASLFQPGGTIEVEEVVEDVFDESRLDGAGDYGRPNGSIASDHAKKSEDKMSLTQSMENLNHDRGDPRV